MATNFDRYEAVRPELWGLYLVHLKHHGATWHAQWVTDESLATLPVGAEPDLVVDRLTEELIRVEPWFEQNSADAWMEAGSVEKDAQLSTVLSSHNQQDVHTTVARASFLTRRGHGLGRSPDDVVRALMRRGVSPQAAYETVLKICQWDNWHASRSARAGEIPRKSLSPLADIEADPSVGWFARLRRGS